MRSPARFIPSAYLLFFFTAMWGSGAFAQGTGYWHTSGNLLLDANNAKVRIAGINWYGFETTDAVVHGLTSQDYKAVLQTVKSNGYNTVRIPLSNQMLETPGSNLNVSYDNSTGPINTDLQGLNSLQILDKIVLYAGTLGLKVILDNHRSEAGNSAEANGLWYTSAYPESAWISDWTMLAQRYLYNSTVIGFDLRNEPHNAASGGACWDCGGANDWHLAAERAGNAVLAVNPSLLIFVEGTDEYNNDYYWWGGNLEGVATSPVALAVANHLVYSAHDYGPHEYAQTWFNGSTSYASLSTVWDTHWAYISQNNLAPVWLGEFGTTNVATDIQNTAAGSQGQWFQGLVNFLTNDGTLNWTYWALNGEDSYDLLDSNYDATPVSALKQTELATIQFALSNGIGTAYPPNPATALTATATSSSQVNLAWAASTTAGSYYTVYFGTSAANMSTVLASGISSTSYSAMALNAATTYYFTVVAVGSGGTSGDSNTASATTQAAVVASPPGAPSGLIATASSSSQINLSWTASATAGVSYIVFKGSSVIASGLGSTSYAVTGLAASTAYSFTVEAVNSSGTSAASNIASATTQAAAQTVTQPPSGLSASAASPSQVNLSWQSSSTNGATYNVYVGTSPSAVSTLMESGQQNSNYVANNLSSSTTYYFAVVAVAGGVASAASNTVTATTQSLPATPPTNVAAVAASATSISLTWTAVAQNGITYNIYVGTSSGATNSQLASGVSGTSYTAIGLNASTTYYFTMRGVSSAGTSSPSNQASATTPAASAPVVPPAVPTAPSSLTATATSSSQINLAWQASTTSGVTYTVSSGSAVIASGLNATAFSVTALTPSTAYSFTVVAVNAAGSSAASNIASATTQAGVSAPTAPTALTATATSSSQINLAWAASTTSGVTYNVLEGTSAGAMSVMASNISGTSYGASALTASTAYYFSVVAVSSAGTSPVSNIASATTQAAATGPCHVAYTDLTDWGVGFTAGITITNNGSTAWNAWTLTWTYAGNQQVYQSWNGNYTETGEAVSIVNASWNGTVAAGAAVTGVGFNANYTGSNIVPTTFYVNGQACK